MAEDNDPFAALNQEEGTSGFVKFCIFLAVAALMLAMYVHSSGISEQYKEPPISEGFSIEGLESKELSSDDLEDYENSKKEESTGSDKKDTVIEDTAIDEPKIPSPLPEKEETVKEENAPSFAGSSFQVEQEYKAPDDLPVSQPVAPIEKQKTDFQKSDNDRVLPSPPVIKDNNNENKPQSIGDGLPPLSMDTLYQPAPSKGEWKKELPDYSKLNRTQRMTPIANQKFDESFNNENGEYGISPTLGKPSDYFKKTYQEEKTGSAKIAVVVYGLGQSPGNTAAAINSLPADVSMSFSPYSLDLIGMIDNARMAGHETLLDVPLQSKNYPLVDPGAMGLLQSNTVDDNNANMVKLLSQKVPVIGFFSINGDAFTVSAPLVSYIVDVVKKRGLVFVDANVETIVGEYDLDYLKTNVVITNNMFKEQIIASLLDAKRIALEKGYVSVAIDAGLLSIQLLKEFIEKDVATNPNLELAPISFLIN